ncbi:uncharacterized protein LOC106130151 isoform X1 [Amyelois transitella]|uniref:uncharacterized protein LOC106130151 isoform X1 n=1 Tax=Amyelois transitella TaxID=680683 RepID=UPI00298FED35|nr:uncharacterized protein LOC106130151 isoform X1 [Amyelois transitella]
MDILYDNLDNYNEANLILELRNENQELKAKLGKYTVALDKLQKNILQDFDKLAGEYKKLEMNYSSLLKTARAEVERKTQIIANLNMEKDMMVLNAIQNNNVNIRRNLGTAIAKRKRQMEMDAQNVKTAGHQLDIKNSGMDRKESSKTPTDEAPRVSQSDAKENIHEDQRGKTGGAAGIRGRRKSMPASRIAKFSSDEEDEPSNPKQRNPFPREDDPRRNTDRNYHKDNKPPDPRNRIFDNDRTRNSDKSEYQRRRYSPERFLHRFKRDFSGDQRRRDFNDLRRRRESQGGYRSDKDAELRSRRDGSGEYRSDKEAEQRLRRSGDRRLYRGRSGERRPYPDRPRDHKPRSEDFGDHHRKPDLRKRRLESPPGEKFHQYDQKNQEDESFCLKEFDREYYDERNKYLEEVGPAIYHSDYDYEEPSCKRPRTDSYHRIEQDNHKVQYPLDQAPQFVIGNIRSEYMSCQSPDYMTKEAASTPKEIKFDADVKMDDPREHSNKYTIRTENGEKVMTTIAARNVDLRPVNKSLWKIADVKVPTALARRPSECSEDRISEVYGIDASDVSSMESGEILGSAIYDISSDPFHYESNRKKSNHGEIKKPAYPSSHLEKETSSVEKVVGYPKSFKQPSAQVEKDTNHPIVSEKAAIRTESRVDLHTREKQSMQAEKIVDDKDMLSSKKSVLPIGSEKHMEDARNPIKFPTTRENIDKNTNIEKQTSECGKNEEPVKRMHCPNDFKTKYKIPKLKSKDQSVSCEKKQSDNKQLENKLKTENHDNSSLKHTYNRSGTCVENSMERKKDHVTADSGKGMVEGDLELSDESCDVDLMKRVMKDIAERTSCESGKSKIERSVVEKNENVASECAEDKYSKNIVKENDVALKADAKQKKGESNDTNKVGKNKTTKEKITETLKSEPEGTLQKHLKSKAPENVVSKEIKNKFSDLFGDSSSLITPEDLGLTAPEVRIESSSSNYIPIFEDAQDAVDLGEKVSHQIKLSLPDISPEGQAKIDFNTDINKKPSKSSEKEFNIDKSSDKEVTKHNHKDIGGTQKEQHNVRSIDKNDIKTKSSKSVDKEHALTKGNESKKPSKTVEKQRIDSDETKQKRKSKNANIDNPLITNENVNEITKTKHRNNIRIENCSDTKMERTGETNKVKLSEHLEIQPQDGKSSDAKIIEHCHKSTEKYTENDTKTLEVKRRKSKRHEEKSQLPTETVPSTLPTVEKNADITASTQITAIRPNIDALNPEEPDIVKTVIISSGVQPVLAENLPSTNISPILEASETPNIDARQMNQGNPLLSHSLLHALATSTPAKENFAQSVHIDESSRMTDFSNGSNEQTSQSNNGDSHNEAPDVRIFVKRRRRAIKKSV